ncbi:hypothetical protein RUMHYD_02047 [Blautia hydrogenotrophica DSM 10507]|uniref:Uncharacterized protein n=1 Tax=Blautia hydrogenotrophica (strain DSM 10507 / JCM 14656 / S5a33) TaxID=476272 RepID=C0CMG4_BLAHS|nr:hypothetical protein RUMHYD_02047 [Blautia hydrogenotrophica DSM 10507]
MLRRHAKQGAPFKNEGAEVGLPTLLCYRKELGVAAARIESNSVS